MRLDCLDELVESRRRKCSIDRFKVQPSDGGHAWFVAPRAENKPREPGQFLPLIGDVTYCRPEHAMPRGKLKQSGSPRR
jgi:hypothetical protein